VSAWAHVSWLEALVRMEDYHVETLYALAVFLMIEVHWRLTVARGVI